MASTTTPPLESAARSAPLLPVPRSPGMWLVLVFLGLAAGIVGAGYAFFQHQRKANELAARAELTAIADLKVSQLQRWFRDRLDDAEHLQKDGVIAPLVGEFLAEPLTLQPRFRLSSWMASLRRHHDYPRVALLDGELQVRLAVPADTSPPERHVLNQARESLQTGRINLVDLYRTGKDGAIRLGLIVPMPGPDGKSLGAVWLEMSPEPFLFPRLRAWPSASPSGETLMVRREGEELVFVNELRHQSNTALRLRFPLTRRDVPSVRAVLGEEGIVEGADYRGVQVLAALRRVQDTPWYVVAKVDRSEIDAPLWQQARLLAVALGALLLVAGLGVAVSWRRQQLLADQRELQERRRSAAVLQESEEQLRRLYSAMTEMVVVHDVVTDAAGDAIDYRIVNCNPAFEAALGIPREKAIGALASQLYGTGSAPFLDRYAAVAATGVPVQFEVYFPPIQKHFEISVFSPRRGQFATVTNDITKRKVAETERDALLHELERKNEELESMIYVASHDLRAPLVNVQGFGERLEKACAEINGGASPEVAGRMTKALRHIRASAAKMDVLINGLLRVSRVGRVAFTRQRVDMDGLMGRVRTGLEIQIQQAGAQLEIEVLPPCVGDKELLEQVFTNLVDNAVKYRAPGRPLRVTVSGRAEAAKVIYTVADTGRGIATAHQGKVWEMFHRLHPDEPVAGEGLGLKIVRRIVTRHGGQVWLESTAGEGTRFFVALPLNLPLGSNV